ncbi:hypothetical protein [Roseiconus lacunae]|uniref:hypothetical protein n=1 Tax=Roseiconus lacunae TaxID=2605694 RepID=UPI0011F3B219|nr:hypothetical protein [Roseiconus lacunae]
MTLFVETDSLTITLDPVDDRWGQIEGGEGKPSLPLAVALELLVFAAAQRPTSPGHPITIHDVRQHRRLSPNSEDAFAIELRRMGMSRLGTGTNEPAVNRHVRERWGLYCDRRDRDGQIVEHSSLHYSSVFESVDFDVSGDWIDRLTDIELDQRLADSIPRSRIFPVVADPGQEDAVSPSGAFGQLQSIGYGRCPGADAIPVAAAAFAAPDKSPLWCHHRRPSNDLTGPGVLAAALDLVARFGRRMIRDQCEPVGIGQLVMGRQVDVGEPLIVIAKWLATTPGRSKKEKDGGVCTATILGANGDLVAKLIGVDLISFTETDVIERSVPS